MAAAKIGLGCIPVTGGSVDIQAFVDDTDRRFRVLKARIHRDTGEYEIIASSDAIMTITDSDPDALYPCERWVVGYTADSEGMLIHIIAARVYGLSDDAVPRLILGPATELGTEVVSPPPNAGFYPEDEDDLEGMDDPNDAEENGGLAVGG